MSAEVVAVIQARTGSTRLPRKVLRDLVGVPVLAHVIRRLHSVPQIDDVVVATTTSDQDDEVAALARNEGALVTRGSERDVLARFTAAFREHGGRTGIRITSDCPCVDPRMVGRMVDEFSSGPSLDYLSNVVVRSFPRGYDVEVFAVDALRRADDSTRDSSSREHVTPYLYRHPEQFRIAHFTRDDPKHSAEWRLTLDEEADWRVLECLFRDLYDAEPLFGLEAVEAFFSANPDVLTWNSAVVQRAH